jgi:dTMP kinase
VFVSFEGIDGSGKSTQARRLAVSLRGLGRRVVETREPGGTELGERIRELLLGDARIAPAAEAALFAGARAQLVDEVIAPAIAAGADVVCDRYVDSSLAYQGVARGLGTGAVLALNELALGGLLPDLTFVLAVPVEEAMERCTGRDRIEAEGRAFLARVDAGYRELATAFPDRIAVIDGSGPPDAVAREILDRLGALLEPAGVPHPGWGTRGHTVGA